MEFRLLGTFEAFDSSGQPLMLGRRTGAGAGVTSSRLDEDGLARSVTDANGNTTDYEYDEDGEAVVTIPPAVMTESGGGAPVQARAVSFAGYNTFGEQTETKDPNGNVTVTAYDAAGRVRTITGPSYTPPGSTIPIVPVETRDYDAQGQLITVTDPFNRITRYAYDQLGRVSKETAPNLGETLNTYDLLGDQLSETDPNGAVSTATYDYLGRVLTATDVVRQTGTSHTTTNTYGLGGWLSQVRTPAGVVTKTFYNAAGEEVTFTDAANNVARFDYDAAGAGCPQDVAGQHLHHPRL
ncbi:MAG TPA: hypothetical protein VFC19_16465 [Candidatus Limnocylindrales bacterium]|nr:hypothetical protein [Candidatus Limnocylindrales bacterium]